MDIHIKTSSKMFTNRNVTKLENQGQKQWIEIAKNIATEWEKVLINAMKIPLKNPEKDILESITGECYYILDNSKK